MKHLKKIIFITIIGSVLYTHTILASSYSSSALKYFLNSKINLLTTNDNSTTKNLDNLTISNNYTEGVSKIPHLIEITDFEKEVVVLVNQQRAKYGLNELTLDIPLSYIADQKSLDMQEFYYFEHKSPTYGTPYNMVHSFGLKYGVVGENLAKGHKTPSEVVDAWMYSSSHRANILNPSFELIGVGHQEDQNVWTQLFVY
ncbi:MAG: hypothetical protein ATN31_04695 [Candidatus Epulonipiscioides saccharophilum]|nr:MAG: hypothetical protein ATN31_04695 [Epulopiscium sp. AS2M-Bin001]